jgi:hypothetical protein
MDGIKPAGFHPPGHSGFEIFKIVIAKVEPATLCNMRLDLVLQLLGKVHPENRPSLRNHVHG